MNYHSQIRRNVINVFLNIWYYFLTDGMATRSLAPVGKCLVFMFLIRLRLCDDTLHKIGSQDVS